MLCGDGERIDFEVAFVHRAQQETYGKAKVAIGTRRSLPLSDGIMSSAVQSVSSLLSHLR